MAFITLKGTNGFVYLWWNIQLHFGIRNDGQNQSENENKIIINIIIISIYDHK